MVTGSSSSSVGLKNRAPSLVDAGLCAFWRASFRSASVLVAVPVVFELRADFAAWTARGVDVHVSRPSTDSPNKLIELTGAESLCGSPCADVRGPDRAADRSTGRRTSLRPCGPVAQICAQEHDDRPGVRPVLEVDVGLCRGRFETSVGQPIADLASPAVDGRPKLPDPGRRERRDLLLARHPLANAVSSACHCDRHDSDRKCAGSDYGERELAA